MRGFENAAELLGVSNGGAEGGLEFDDLLSGVIDVEK